MKGTAQGIAAAGAGRERNASYPFEVPYRLVNMYSVEGDTVLDPFAGLGTTALACMAAKRSSIGCEVDAGIAALARENLLAQPQRLNRAVDARLERHEAFIAALPGDKYDKCYDNPYHGFKVKTKQETAIRLERLTGVKTGDGEIICTYG